MATKGSGKSVGSLQHRAKRKNLPPAGLESHGRVGEVAPHRYEFNPHLPPTLRSSPDARDADRLPDIVQRAHKHALNEGEAQLLAAALRRHEPWLEWAGKRERPWFEVDPVALHMHERVSTEAMLRAVRRKDVQRSLFGDPELDYAKAVQFYRHDVHWTNRLILGDSLQVMASLARREDLAGKVQMIYVDPPYGISFRSNFQPDLGRRDVKDQERDLTREPEMVRAYRDTWTLGVHSYLAYLRDRLAMARELLAETGSIFVQISDENVHRVRCVMDEVFGASNFCRIITLRKTAGDTTTLLTSQADYLLWYARDAEQIKYRPLFLPKKVGEKAGTQYDRLFDPITGTTRRFTLKSHADGEIPAGWEAFRTADLRRKGYSRTATIPIEFEGETYFPKQTHQWKTNAEGLARLRSAERLHVVGQTLEYRRYFFDWNVSDLTNIWMDAGGSGFAEPREYVVQTVPRIIERCILMATDPGDLVVDPTCGSGTTAFVAEKWGRRWITIDTSRVALTLAKHRLMTASFDYYRLRPPTTDDIARNTRGPWLSGQDSDGAPTGEPATLDCRTVPHITLGSIARNTSLDPIFEKHQPLLDSALTDLNAALADVTDETKTTLAGKLIEKHRKEGSRAVTDADVRRWLLPGTSLAGIRPERARGSLKQLTAKQLRSYEARIPTESWRSWEVPFDADPDWPAPLREALTAYRTAWRAKMDEVNACIAANAEIEELVDQPYVESGAVRVAGPFSVEGVIAVETGLDSPIGGAPGDLETFPEPADDHHTQNGEAHIAKVIRLLRASGVEFPGQAPRRFARLEAASGALLHAEGEWEESARRVAVSVGPEFGNLTALQVERALRDAHVAGYDEVVFAAFGFDAAAPGGGAERRTPDRALSPGPHQSRCGHGRPAQDPAGEPDLHGLCGATSHRARTRGGRGVHADDGGHGRV